MSYSILIKPEAERDLQNAYLFYEEQRIGLGLEFLFATEAEIKRIQKNPDKIVLSEFLIFIQI